MTNIKNLWDVMNKHILPGNNSINSRGKSFRFLGDWKPNIEYKNDIYVQDFVYYGGILWGCLETCVGRIPAECSPFWKRAVKGVKGEKGKEIVSMYEFGPPEWDNDFCYCTIMVVYSDGTTEPFELKLKLMKGDKGDPGESIIGPTGATGETGPIGPTGLPGKDGVDGHDGMDGHDGKDGKDGKDGSIVTIGSDGYWYIDGIKTETRADFQGVIDSSPRANSSNPITSSAVYILKTDLKSDLNLLEERIESVDTSAVNSVNGQTGDVNITTESIGAASQDDILSALSWK